MADGGENEARFINETYNNAVGPSHVRRGLCHIIIMTGGGGTIDHYNELAWTVAVCYG